MNSGANNQNHRGYLGVRGHRHHLEHLAARGGHVRIAACRIRQPFSEIRRETLGPLLGIAVLAFFILIGFANAYLAIEPALKENSLARAMKNSAALGLAAYATYIVPVYMTIGNWPFVLVPIDIIIGGFLSLITSTVVTAVAMRMRDRG